MLLLIFQAGNQSYGLDVRNIVEIAPFPQCTPLPHAPPCVAGIVTWRGGTIPVIDLSVLLAGAAARSLLSTRLLVVNYSALGGRSQPLGLLAEKAVEIVEVDETRCEPQKVAIPDAAYLNGTAEHAGKLILLLAVDELLPASLRQLLFPGREAA